MHPPSNQVGTADPRASGILVPVGVRARGDCPDCQVGALVEAEEGPVGGSEQGV